MSGRSTNSRTSAAPLPPIIRLNFERRKLNINTWAAGDRQLTLARNGANLLRNAKKGIVYITAKRPYDWPSVVFESAQKKTTKMS